VAIDYEVSRLPTGALGWQGLLAAIESSAATDENMWLEHKAGLDPSTKPGAAALAKAIIAFANRDPNRSTAWLGGHAIVVIGLEPGNVPGIEPLDPAVLHDKVSRYLAEPSPHWDSADHTYNGRDVLVITIDPPKDGDPIYTIGQDGGDPKAGGQVRNGDIYVRRPGKSELAKADDIQRLTRRASGASTATTLALSLAAPENFSIPWVGYTDGWVDRWTQSQRKELLKPLPKPPKKPSAASLGFQVPTNVLQGLMDTQLAATKSILGDRYREEERTEAEFRAEVERFLDEAAERLPAAIEELRWHCSRSATFVVQNDSDRNYKSVEIAMHVEGKVVAYNSPLLDPRPLRKFAGKPPRAWGPRIEKSPYEGVPDRPYVRPQSVQPYIPGPRRPEIREGGSIDIDFVPFDLRPGGSHVLDDVALIAKEHFAEATRCTWKATASNVDAILEGEFMLRLAEDATDVSSYLG
jgi:hypothetical protein